MDAPRSRRRSVPFLLGLAAILTALPLGYFLFLHRPPAAPSSPAPLPVVEAPRPGAPPEKRPLELKLEEIRGTVEVRRGGEQWRAASVGEALHPSDAVRTLEGSYAVIIGGEAVEVRMEAGAEVSVEVLTHSLSRLLLSTGMTTARVNTGDGQTLEMKATGSDAVARTEGGTFTMSNNGAGTVALATLVGEVAFSGSRKVVIVRAGQQSIVRPGREPTAPTPVPTSLLLKVNWPARPRRQVVISGQADPGSHVKVGGQVVPTDEEGRFSHAMSLEEGPNSIQVHARSVGGLLQEEKRDFTLDTTPPSPVKVDPGLWDEPRPQHQ